MFQTSILSNVFQFFFFRYFLYLTGTKFILAQSLRGGQDIRGALIGPGVAASHGMERSHVDAVENTMKLLIAYMTKKD